jgi:Holliday junction resolvasome RuvABC endonuclease subunit
MNGPVVNEGNGSSSPIVIGVDASLSATGIALPGMSLPGRLLTVNGGKSAGPARLVALRDRIMDYAQHAELVCLEGYSFGSRGKGTISLGELGGVLRVALHEAGVRVAEIPPASLKRYATGRGNSGKSVVVVAAVKRLGLEPADDNEADAAWLRAMGMDALGWPLCTVPAAHRKALEAVRWPALARRTV